VENQKNQLNERKKRSRADVKISRVSRDPSQNIPFLAV